jgi:hypothetical protein
MPPGNPPRRALGRQPLPALARREEIHHEDHGKAATAERSAPPSRGPATRRGRTHPGKDDRICDRRIDRDQRLCSPQPPQREANAWQEAEFIGYPPGEGPAQGDAKAKPEMSLRGLAFGLAHKSENALACMEQGMNPGCQ